MLEGKGGGPVAGTGLDGAEDGDGDVGGNGGGPRSGDAIVASASVEDFFTGSDAALSAERVADAGADPRNSEIGCQEDFASFQARSVRLKLPSVIFSRMADSEKRPASCPFR
jgi:hypothetical protein